MSGRNTDNENTEQEAVGLSEEVLDQDMRRVMESLERKAPPAIEQHTPLSPPPEPRTAPPNPRKEATPTVMDASDTFIFKEKNARPDPAPALQKPPSSAPVKPPIKNQALTQPIKNSTDKIEKTPTAQNGHIALPSPELRGRSGDDDLEKWLRDPEGHNREGPANPALRNEPATTHAPEESYSLEATSQIVQPTRTIIRPDRQSENIEPSGSNTQRQDLSGISAPTRARPAPTLKPSPDSAPILRSSGKGAPERTRILTNPAASNPPVKRKVPQQSITQPAEYKAPLWNDSTNAGLPEEKRSSENWMTTQSTAPLTKKNKEEPTQKQKTENPVFDRLQRKAQQPLSEEVIEQRSVRRGRTKIIAYGIAASTVLALIWGPTALYVTMSPPQYETKWRIILPGEGVQTALRLDDLGEARTSTRSPFSSRNIDPRTTYKEIASSSIVAAIAAEEIGVQPASFEKPKVSVVPQTGILEFRLRRGSPEEVTEHALAYIAGFDTRVDILRQSEIDKRSDVSDVNLEALRVQLEEKRAEIQAQRENGGLVAPQEFNAQVDSLAKLDVQLTEGEIELSDLENEFVSLTAALGISPQTASHALTLKGDRLFQTLSKFYAESEGELAQLRGNLGPRHPDLLAAQVRRNELRRDVILRSEVLIGQVPQQLGRVMDLTLSAERGSLFSRLVETNAILEGQRARVEALRNAARTKRLTVERLSTEVEGLSALESEIKVAETLYTSALANADLSRSDPFASYPLYQLLDAPPTPMKPVSPKKTEAVAGAVLASLLVLLGFGAIWLRQRNRRARRKRNS